MLILARRPDEKIVFPSIGVTLHVIRIQGNAVRIGIDAPRSLEILREELVGTPYPSHRSIETPAARARWKALQNVAAWPTWRNPVGVGASRPR